MSCIYPSSSDINPHLILTYHIDKQWTTAMFPTTVRMMTLLNVDLGLRRGSREVSAGDIDPSMMKIKTECADSAARLIPRTPNPYLATDFALRVSDPSSWAQRERRQRSKAPGRIFEGLRFHCFSATEDGEKEAKMMSSKIRVSDHDLPVMCTLTRIRGKEVKDA